ncbi:MAG: SH3 domain-containing protein [Lachnospiraceae bacterium]|nr:SH3 domain-containing protein [Lachnospiraceae bacterium]
MEENTMNKNGAEESQSVPDRQGGEPVSEGGKESTDREQTVSAAEEQRARSRSTSQPESEQRTGRRRVSQTGDSQRATGARAARSRTSQSDSGKRAEGRRADRTGGAGSRRASGTTGGGRTEVRRVGRSAAEERTESRKAVRKTEGGQMEVRKVSRTAEEESRRVSQADGQDVARQARPVRAASLEREERRERAREAQAGKFGLGHKKTRRSAIVYLFEDIAEGFVRAKNWCVKNYRTSIPAAICLVLVIVVACILVRNFRTQPTPVSGNTEDMVPEYPLEQDAHEEVNSFFQRYYEAIGYGDVETYASMRSYTDDEERVRIQKKANYIDYYQNLSCYTKPGPVDNSYLVYVYYEVKFSGIHTPAPGLNTFFLCTNDAGELYVFSDKLDRNVKDYMRRITTQQDVKDLFNRVKVTYDDTVASDKELEEFLSTLAQNLKDEVTLALSELEAENQIEENGDGNDGEGEAEPTPTPEEPEPTPEVEPEPQTDMVMTTNRVNVRSSASPEATKLGTVNAGTRFTRYESLENGWSRIDYEGSEAYIKTEFLQVIEETIGKVKALNSVNIRASASEDATKLGTVGAGTMLDLIENQENGWSRILFNGSTAYVKTEFLDIENMTE